MNGITTRIKYINKLTVDQLTVDMGTEFLAPSQGHNTCRTGLQAEFSAKLPRNIMQPATYLWQESHQWKLGS